MTVQPRGDWEADIGWPIDVAKALGEVYGDGIRSPHLVITDIDFSQFIIQWFNDSLPTSVCPREEILRLEDKIRVKDSGEAKPVLVKVFSKIDLFWFIVRFKSSSC